MQMKDGLNPLDRQRRAQAWQDGRQDNDASSAYEPTYPDGSVKHECWAHVPKKSTPAVKKTNSQTDGEKK